VVEEDCKAVIALRYEVWGFQGRNDILRYDTKFTSVSEKHTPSMSGLKSKPGKQSLLIFMTHSFTPKTETVCSFKTMTKLCQTTWYHIPDYRLFYKCFERCLIFGQWHLRMVSNGNYGMDQRMGEYFCLKK
jgi:hypothetical protein